MWGSVPNTDGSRLIGLQQNLALNISRPHSGGGDEQGVKEHEHEVDLSSRTSH